MPSIEERLDLLEREVAVLKAEDGIRKTLSQYAIAVDDKRPDLLTEIFAEDAFLKVPAWNVDLAGMSAILGFFTEYWSRFDNPRRYYANEDITIDRVGGKDGDGGTAAAFMYWHVTQERDGESYVGWGAYDWNFRCTGGRWLITREVVNIRAMTTLARGWAGPEKLEPL